MSVEGHQTQLCLQLVIDTMALGYLLVAASILLTGNTFTRTKEFGNVLSLSIAKMSLFLKIQEKHLKPCPKPLLHKAKKKNSF